jgi:hypothetical protein
MYSGGCENETLSFLDNLKTFVRPLQNEGYSITIEEGVGWKDADRHLCSMVESHLFIQGAGGFSYLAERVRTRRGEVTVKELVRYPIIWLQAELELAHQESKKRMVPFLNSNSTF